MAAANGFRSARSYIATLLVNTLAFIFFYLPAYAHTTRYVPETVVRVGRTIPTDALMPVSQSVIPGANIANSYLSAAAQAAASDLVSSQLVRYVEQNQPVIRDWNTIYPHVDSLPGPAFHPGAVPQSVWRKSLVASGYQSISLPPGDYSLPVQLYCMHFAGGSGPGFTYLLGPFLGTRARMISTLIGRASIRHAPHMAVQVHAWELQVGDNYVQLDSASRALFNQLLPEFRTQMGPGFLQTIAQYWNTLAGSTPGLPSFQATVGQIAPLSSLLATYRRAQLTIAQNAGNYQALSQRLLFTRLGGEGMQTQVKPWSIVAPGIYERVVTAGGAMSRGTLEIRVLPTAVTMQQVDKSHFIPVSLQNTTNTDSVSVPIETVVGYPVNCNNCQIPLSEILSANMTSSPLQTENQACTTTSGNSDLYLYPASVSGLTATVNGVVIVPPGDTLTGIDWNWGDGTTQTGCVYFPESHTYATGGTYTITVTATGTSGFELQHQETVSVIGSSTAARSSVSTASPLSSTAALVAGTWTGTYLDYQGQHVGIKFVITPISGNVVTAVASLFQIEGETGLAPSGSQRLEGTFDPGSMTLTFNSASWVVRGTGYGTCGKIISTISPDNYNLMTGAVAGHCAYEPLSAVGTFSLTRVANASRLSSLTFAQSSLPTGTVGQRYWAILNMTGGAAPYSWTLVKGKLPAGLNLNYGAITGTPISAGRAEVTVMARDSAENTVQKSFSLIVNDATNSLTASTGSPVRRPTRQIAPMAEPSGTASESPTNSSALLKITSVTFSGSGSTRRIFISGQNFGSSPIGLEVLGSKPVRLPFQGDVDGFDLYDETENFHAGGGTSYPGDLANLAFEAWSSSEINIGGLSWIGWALHDGDKIELTVPNGKQSSTWIGRVPTDGSASIEITVQLPSQFVLYLTSNQVTAIEQSVLQELQNQNVLSATPFVTMTVNNQSTSLFSDSNIQVADDIIGCVSRCPQALSSMVDEFISAGLSGAQVAQLKLAFTLSKSLVPAPPAPPEIVASMANNMFLTIDDAELTALDAQLCYPNQTNVFSPSVVVANMNGLTQTLMIVVHGLKLSGSGSSGSQVDSLRFDLSSDEVYYYAVVGGADTCGNGNGISGGTSTESSSLTGNAAFPVTLSGAVLDATGHQIPDIAVNIQ